MHYYHENDSVEQKLKSLNFTAEVRSGKLWGVAECQVAGELTPAELKTLKAFAAGQASDGLGECFEQHEIRLSDGSELYAHLWQDTNWSIRAEQEAPQAENMQQNMELKFGGM